MSEPVQVEVNAELQKAIAGAINPEDIKAAILAEATRQQSTAAQKVAEQAAADQAKAAKAEADKKAAEAAALPQVFARTVTINGKDFNFEADSELELERMVNNAWAVASALTPDSRVEPTPTVQQDEAARKAAADAETARQAELELKFKRGEITTAQFLEQSGAIERHLAEKGLSVDKLKETVAQSEISREQQSWADATKEFLATSDWPGGERNLNLIGMQIEKMELLDAQDKVGALRRAYSELKSRNMLFDEAPRQPQTETERQAAAQTAAQDAEQKAAIERAQAAERERAAAAVSATPVITPTNSSSLWGRSSGVGDTTSVVKQTDVVEIPKDASPQEILETWKRSQLAAGIHPDDAFKSTFSARR